MKFKSFSFVSYAIKDVKKARNFYENILGLKASSVWEGKGYAFIEYNIGPDTLAIGKGAKNFKPGKTGATVALEVHNFEKAVKELRAKRVKIVMEPYESPVCSMILIADPDGNQIMIHKKKGK